MPISASRHSTTANLRFSTRERGDPLYTVDLTRRGGHDQPHRLRGGSRDFLRDFEEAAQKTAASEDSVLTITAVTDFS